MTNLKFIIPTVREKREWLKRTVLGITHQVGISPSITLLVDRKPWDEDVDISAEMSVPVEIVECTPASRVKRQHQMVNGAMAALPPDEPVCIMDDDYWCLTTDAIAKLLESWKPGHMAVPCWYYSTPHPVIPSGKVEFAEHTIVYEDVEKSGHIRRTYDGSFGMHPCCGNPKIVTPRTWAEVGGFPDCYRHYWFADTELFIKARSIIEHAWSDMFIHADHTRRFPEMFSKHNAEIFMARVGRFLPNDDQYRKLAEEMAK